MHGKGGTISTPDEEKITICKEESESIIFNGSNEAKRYVYVLVYQMLVSLLKLIWSDHCLLWHSACVETEDNTTNMPNSNQVQDTESTYVDAQNAQTAEDYNVLLNQYNAVEEQRQKLLGQLYQYGNWDYQSYGYGGVYDSQDRPPQPSGPPACSCQPYVCPCSTKVSCNEDDGVIKAAMGAIDKVIQTFNTGDKG